MTVLYCRLGLLSKKNYISFCLFWSTNNTSYSIYHMSPPNPAINNGCHVTAATARSWQIWQGGQGGTRAQDRRVSSPYRCALYFCLFKWYTNDYFKDFIQLTSTRHREDLQGIKTGPNDGLYVVWALGKLFYIFFPSITNVLNIYLGLIFPLTVTFSSFSSFR